MILFKKVLFALPFLLSFLYYTLQLNPFLEQPEILLEFNEQVLVLSALLIGSLLLASFFFSIFTTLASDWKIVLPIILLISITTFFFVPTPFNLILTIGSLLTFLINYLLLFKKLTSYISFHPPTLLAPTIKTTAALLLVISSIAFYFSYQAKIEKQGFQIPESLLNMSMQFSGTSLPQQELGGEQLEILKQNPDLLKQYGLDPALLDSLDQPQSLASNELTPPNSNLVKTLINQQLNSILKPYQDYIPLFFAFTFFLTFNWIASLLSFIPALLSWLLFYILEKIGFITFQTETREVKKMVV